MVVLASHPEHLEAIETVYLGDEPGPRRLQRVRFRGDEALLRVEGLETPADVAARRGQLVRVDREAMPPLPQGEHYHYQLIGLDVVDVDGRPLGRLAEIVETGANDVYVVIGPEGELLLPAIEEVVHEVDLEAGRIVVKPQEYY
jgi:16S rRNA processing protein RimM